ncbi:MAG: HD domain-containing protein [Lachnospiraceae bacterium]|nr:HD domain-containing protein [Lachnospiraceae bacterium]
MNYVNQILQNETYRGYLKQNEEKERERIFCHHDLAHFLDVARIGMIINLEEGYGLPQEFVYAAALLHDIGRWKQYEDGEDHAAVSARLCGPILTACQVPEDEADLIRGAIASHRDAAVRDEKSLRGLLYRADKLSRPCFGCRAEGACNWKADKKNRELIR